MLPLLGWCVIGIVIRVLFVLVFTVQPNVKSTLKMAGLCVAVGAVGAYFLGEANLSGWFMKAVAAAGGFLMVYLVEKLNKIKI